MTEIPHFDPHAVQWTPEKVARTWDYLANRDTLPGRYFSATVGGAIADFARKHDAPLDRTLDFGCGPGFLLEALWRRGVRADGIDFSERSVEVARQRMKDLGFAAKVTRETRLPTSLQEGGFDTIFLIETIEHLLDHELAPVLTELRRLLRPGGLVVVTTPHAEDFEASVVQCPDCGCRFHGMQHLRTWTPASLAATVEAAGFTTRICRPTFFNRDAWISRAYGFALVAAGMKLPHLAYVGVAQ